ncbi:acetyl-CoA carboxylase biotin carboxyl carrier protein [bacterium]|nr:acetyl-CoA carboxylase biotin carboxyl carrier protein [bacterium]
MDLEQIKRLIDLLLESQITEIEVEEEGTRIRVSRQASVQQVVAAAPGAPAPGFAPMSITPAPGVEESPFQLIKAPMVGTFYRAPSPDAVPYVKIGDEVHPETVVCILEAMKIMNELKAGVSGVVRNILVENGEAVEYGQPLFEIEPR